MLSPEVACFSCLSRQEDQRGERTINLSYLDFLRRDHGFFETKWVSNLQRSPHLFNDYLTISLEIDSKRLAKHTRHFLNNVSTTTEQMSLLRFIYRP